MPPIPRLKAQGGPAILSYGFRPFFLLGSLWAGFAVLVWVPAFMGAVEIPTALAPRDWHIHEMLYGYLAAVVTGFLLTAIPNWTGRLPLQGGPLLVLVLTWTAGRAAMASSALIGTTLAAVIDAAFLILLGGACAREVIAGRNWRNLKVLAILLLFFAGNLVFHVETIGGGLADYGIRIGVGAAVGLIMLVGGRVVPSFTRNWLARMNPGRMPTPFGRFDAAAMAAGGVALLAWVVAPEGTWTGTALLAAGLLQAVRLARWAGDRALGDPLVLVLHLGYVFVPIGFLLVAAASFGIAPQSAGLHAWTGGAVGIMTLAIMTRASLGHTGRSLVASRGTQAIYAAALVAVIGRVASALSPELGSGLLVIAALAWAAAFLGFGAVYGPLLMRPALRAGG